MKTLEAEIAGNFGRFCAAYKGKAQETADALAKHNGAYLDSYRRLVSIQAWRAELLESLLSPGSLAFFLEAQNDAITSHVLAAYGGWRSSLKALRSCIENVCFAMYYKDHPVELQLWDRGKHRLAYSELAAYFEVHPAFDGIGSASPLAQLGHEYSTLSRAVHGTGKTFRMSNEQDGVQFWTADVARLGMWGTRESHVISALNTLLLILFREHLQGGKLPNLRKAISLAIPQSRHAGIKAAFEVTLFKP
jgi:hypothetical protein